MKKEYITKTSTIPNDINMVCDMTEDDYKLITIVPDATIFVYWFEKEITEDYNDISPYDEEI
jgi:hypothetical protein